MVGVSYHELTAGNPQAARHSAGQRKQFLLICVVGVAVCANAFINAGLFDAVTIKDDGIYPGGDFIYKLIEDKYVLIHFVLCVFFSLTCFWIIFLFNSFVN